MSKNVKFRVEVGVVGKGLIMGYDGLFKFYFKEMRNY